MNFIRTLSLATVALLITGGSALAQPLNKKKEFTLQDTLRGSNTPERAWWNVTYYAISVTPDYTGKTIKGSNRIGFDVIADTNGKQMQIDLQEPMLIDSIILDGKKKLEYKRTGNVFYADLGKTDLKKEAASKPGSTGQHSLLVYFHGKPREARNPPWDGGWIWRKDDLGRPWMTVACQGLGASVWYPCKDIQADEPDNGASLAITVPDTLVAVGNGRLASKVTNKDNTTTYTWKVVSPINNYDIIPYIGKYVHFEDNYDGEKGKLSLDYWVLDNHLAAAQKQFTQNVKPMLKCFEFWFGPYPFYEDGYKLVESSHLGMEHQSAVAYGNRFMNGYLGSDLSGSGFGKDWDYIIVHESGHEWFGNNITTNDIADMWVHEGITDYSETLFVESLHGKQAGSQYTHGLRDGIRNDIPVIGTYGVNQEGSGDMYNKGNNLIHMIRQVINDDILFRKIMRGLNSEFYHKTVNSADVEAYFSRESGKDLSKIFDQYLRTTKIPIFEYRIKDGVMMYEWTNAVDGFNLPIRIAGTDTWIKPNTYWQQMPVDENFRNGFKIDPDFYCEVRVL